MSTPPNTTATPIPFAQMLVGKWQPLGATSRTLEPIVQQGAQRTPIGNIGTASVRRIDQVAGPAWNANLMACGRVRRTNAVTSTVPQIVGLLR